MRILIFDDNLMWSSRLSRTAQALGHEAVVLSSVPEELPSGDVAILNLGNEKLCSESLILGLAAQGTRLVGHAGHKEKPLLEAGRAAGIKVVSNSTLTHHFETAIAE